MEQSKAKTYRIWYYVFLIVGLVGIFDLATRSMVLETYKIDVGYAVLGAFFPLRFLFGTHIATVIMVYSGMILGFAPLWLVLAYFFNKKSKAIENPSEENQKKSKRAKIWLWVVAGVIIAFVIIAFMLFVVFLLLSNSA